MPERRLKRTSKSTHFGAKKKQKLVRFGKHFGSLKLGILGNHFNTRLEGVPNDTPGVLVQNPYPVLFTASEPTVQLYVRVIRTLDRRGDKRRRETLHRADLLLVLSVPKSK